MTDTDVKKLVIVSALVCLGAAAPKDEKRDIAAQLAPIAYAEEAGLYPISAVPHHPYYSPEIIAKPVQEFSAYYPRTVAKPVTAIPTYYPEIVAKPIPVPPLLEKHAFPVGFEEAKELAHKDGYVHHNKEVGSGEYLTGNGFSKKGLEAGGAGYHKTDSYLDDNRHAGDKLAHEGYSSDVSQGSKGHEDGGIYEKGLAYGKDNKLNAGHAINNNYKKGHHTSGFRSTYHKDESGHDTKYYDEDSDEGHHAGAQDIGDYYGAHGLEKVHGKGGAGAFAAGSQGEYNHFGAGTHGGASRGLHDARGHTDYHGEHGGYGHEAAEGVHKGEKGLFGSAEAFHDGGSRALGYLH
ncbi:uncharacterized protein [Anabrus simplex]|uniref:uncharacterized protein n=1 Tax=Anabrus simplex TaxID=316456 RepID=UPI0035A34E32